MLCQTSHTITLQILCRLKCDSKSSSVKCPHVISEICDGTVRNIKNLRWHYKRKCDDEKIAEILLNIGKMTTLSIVNYSDNSEESDADDCDNSEENQNLKVKRTAEDVDEDRGSDIKRAKREVSETG